MDGQTGALSRYGYTFDAAQAKILKYGNEEQRAALLADIVTDSIGNMNEAMANTPQGRAAQLANNFAGLKYQVGVTTSIFRDLMIPVLNKVIAFATAVAMKLQFVGQFFNALFGRSATSQANTQTAATVKQTAAVGGLGKAIETAGKKAKKAGKDAQGSLASFDQLNTLADKSAAGDATGNDSATGADSVDGGNIPFGLDSSGFDNGATNVSKRAQEMAEKVRAAFKQLSTFVTQHKDIIIAALAGLATAFAGFYIASKWGSIVAGIQKAGELIGLALAAIGWEVALVIAIIAALVAGVVYFYRTNETFRGVVDGIWNAIKEAAVVLWQNVLVPFGKWLGKVLVAAWDDVKIACEWLWKNVLVPFGDWLGKAFVASWNGLKVALEWLWKNVLVPMGDFLGGAFKLVWDKLKSAADTLWKDVFIPFGGYLKVFYETVLTPLGNVIKDYLTVAFNSLSEVAKSLWKNILVPLGGFFKDSFGPAVEAVSAIWTFLWKNVLKPLGEFLMISFLVQWQAITTAVQFLWNNVLKPFVPYLIQTVKTAFETIGGVIGGLKDVFIGLANFITGVFTGNWGKAWEGVVSVFKGIFETIVAIAKQPINLIIDALNTLIGGLNKLSFDIPDWVAKLAGLEKGGTFGIHIDSIKHLEKGGITNGPMMAVIGDNPGGREVVSPLSDLQDIIAGAVGSAVMQAMQFNNKPSGGGDIVIKIDGTTMARVLNPHLAKEEGRIGSTLIKTT